MVAYFTNCFTSCFLFVLKYIDKCFIVLMWIYLGYFLSFAFTYTDTHKAPIMALHVGVVLHMYMYSPRSVISFSKVFYVCMLSLLCFALLLLLPNCLPTKWRDSVSSHFHQCSVLSPFRSLSIIHMKTKISRWYWFIFPRLWVRLTTFCLFKSICFSLRFL